MKRDVDIVIISDVHLGTYGCHAKELLNYLNSIRPKKLILNGDIIDIWQFKKRYWPKSHMKILKKIIDLASKKTKVYYISGNHDEMLRKFIPQKMGNLIFKNSLILNLGDKKIWIFHGDIYDFTMKTTKWLAMLGGHGYDLLILINITINKILKKLGRDKVSFSKKIKNSVKKAVKFIGDFENTIAEMAINEKIDIVACGHIHQPTIKKIETKNGNVIYMNSGDWIENLTSIEFHKGVFYIYKYDEKEFESQNEDFELNVFKYEDFKIEV